MAVFGAQLKATRNVFSEMSLYDLAAEPTLTSLPQLFSGMHFAVLQLKHFQVICNQSIQMNTVKGAQRLIGFDKPTVWTVMTPLAIKTKSINLGQGFPSWKPPQFYLDSFEQAAKECNHQYVRAFGSLTLTQAIAQFHRPAFKNINPENQIVTVKGGVEGLFDCFMALVDEGDEVILFDPSYDCYRPQVQMAGGKCIGVPLKPRHSQSQAQLKKRLAQGCFSGEEDEWDIDFKAFEAAITPRTKVLLLNSPHNPVGKVLTKEQISKIASILRKHPRIAVIEDNVYEGITFDDLAGKPLPKMCFEEGMWDRTLSIYSAGKIFAATGARSGWVIGPKHLIQAVRSVHQYNVFCDYNFVESVITQSLHTISQPNSTYLKDYAGKLSKLRITLLRQLIECKYDIDLWIPKGGYFILADITRVQVMQKYLKDEEGNIRTKDYALAVQLAYEDGVVVIPCSPFYAKEDVDLGSKYVRFAFCKDEELILQAGKRIAK